MKKYECPKCGEDLVKEIIYVPSYSFATLSLDKAGELQYNYIPDSCGDGNFECLCCNRIIDMDEDEIKEMLKEDQ